MNKSVSVGITFCRLLTAKVDSCIVLPCVQLNISGFPFGLSHAMSRDKTIGGRARMHGCVPHHPLPGLGWSGQAWSSDIHGLRSLNRSGEERFYFGIKAGFTLPSPGPFPGSAPFTSLGIMASLLQSLVDSTRTGIVHTPSWMICSLQGWLISMGWPWCYRSTQDLQEMLMPCQLMPASQTPILYQCQDQLVSAQLSPAALAEASRVYIQNACLLHGCAVVSISLMHLSKGLQQWHSQRPLPLEESPSAPL